MRIQIPLGFVACAYQGIMCTTHNKMVNIGPPQATVDREKRFRLLPLQGDWHWSGESSC
jgi:hypothetical protein